jgi:hypothetical protein
MALHVRAPVAPSSPSSPSNSTSPTSTVAAAPSAPEAMPNSPASAPSSPASTPVAPTSHTATVPSLPHLPLRWPHHLRHPPFLLLCLFLSLLLTKSCMIQNLLRIPTASRFNSIIEGCPCKVARLDYWGRYGQPHHCVKRVHSTLRACGPWQWRKLCRQRRCQCHLIWQYTATFQLGRFCATVRTRRCTARSRGLRAPYWFCGWWSWFFHSISQRYPEQCRREQLVHCLDALGTQARLWTCQ